LKLHHVKEFCIFISRKILKNTQILKKLVIAIDGPAASGKSTTAKLVARELGYLYLDTGAMYRAMTLKVLEQNIDIGSEEEIVRIANETCINFERRDEQMRIFLDNRDVTKKIRNQTVTAAVSAVSAIKRIREVMVREQRRMSAEGGIVVDGRDIGTVVFPSADLKIFMIADVKERARRRQKDLHNEGIDLPVDQIEFEITERDRKDSARHVSPLKQAADAIMVDTSTMTIDEQVKFIVNRARVLIENA
jgi:CMP/dCMP kinase